MYRPRGTSIFPTFTAYRGTPQISAPQSYCQRNPKKLVEHNPTVEALYPYHLKHGRISGVSLYSPILIFEREMQFSLPLPSPIIRLQYYTKPGSGQ